MRLFIGNCILLACAASVLAAEQPAKEETRPKRDLQFWKSLIASKLGLGEAKPNDETVKILRIPGFENVLVRALPKVTVVEETPPTLVKEEIVQVDPTLAILGAYLGTKTPEETLIALQRVKGLLQSGIIKASDEIIEVMPPKPPVFVLPSVFQGRKDCSQKSVVPMIQKMPMYSVLPPVMPMPALRPLPAPIMPAPIPVMPRPIQVMTALPEMRPLSIESVVPYEFVPTHYSYKQVKDGSVTSYLSEGSQDVIVTQSSRPLPPPPQYIVDRFQKIVYGLPLGVATIQPNLPPIPVVVPKPMANIPYLPLMPRPVIPQPAPVRIQPTVVEVTTTNDERKKQYHGSVNILEGTRVMKAPFTSTLIQEQVALPAPLAVDVPERPLPPVIIETSESDDNQFSYKYLHGNGTISVYSGTETMKQPFTSVLYKDILKLPPPPPEILSRIKEAAGRAHNPKSGYSFKISNGEGYFENANREKIFYSRLLPGGDKRGLVIPDLLSSQITKDDSRNPKVYVISDDNSDKDDLADPFLSKKIKDKNKQQPDSKGFSDTEGQKPKTPGTDITPIKMIPPLPSPVAGMNENGKHANKDGPLRIGGSLNEPDVDITKEKDDGESDKTAGGTLGTKNVLTSPKAVVDVVQPLEKPASVVVNEKIPAFLKAVIDVIQPKPASVLVAERIKDIPVRPSAVIDVIQPLPKPPGVTVSEESHPKIMFSTPVMPSYSYKQISHNNPQPFTVVKVEDTPSMIPRGEIAKPASVLVSERIPAVPKAVIDVIQPVAKPASVLVSERIKDIPVRPSTVIDVIQPLPKPTGVTVIEQSHPKVMFSAPVMSSYSYKQISHNNPQPFTVVKVEDTPSMIPRGEIAKPASVLVSERIPAVPKAVIDVIQPVAKPASVLVSERIKDIPVRPSTVIDVIQPLPKPTGVTVIEQSHPKVMFSAPVMSSYSYKQISHDNPQPFTVVKVKDTPRMIPRGEIAKPASVLVSERIPAVPKAVIDVIQPLAKPASVLVSERIKDIPVRPSAVIDVIQPVPKPAGVTVIEENRPKLTFSTPVMSSYSYKQISHNNPQPFTIVKVGDTPRIEVPRGEVAKPASVLVRERIPAVPKAVIDVIQPVAKPASVIVSETIKDIPVRPSTVIDVIQPLPKPPGVTVIEENRPKVTSSYSYQQISHNNPQSFTVVKVEDSPRIEVPRGDVHVKVNEHKHIRADGTIYPCKEVHLVPGIPTAPLPASPVGVAPTIPKGVLYVPPISHPGVLPPTKHEEKQHTSSFSYIQVKNEGTSTPKPDASTEKPLTLSLNPIVVAPESSNYSYKQIKSDGSSINIKSDQDNTVSVVNDESNRGDIPDALS